CTSTTLPGTSLDVW
nr:immunoglobulin heavy chain junction region [Macaca mulatta]